MSIKFDISDHDRISVDAIMRRVKAELKDFDLHSLRMDLCACHANGNPLDFERLRTADDFNFQHDIYGIEQHMDRTTGQLRNHFRPRFSLKPQTSLA